MGEVSLFLWTLLAFWLPGNPYIRSVQRFTLSQIPVFSLAKHRRENYMHALGRSRSSKVWARNQIFKSNTKERQAPVLANKPVLLSTPAHV